MPFIMTPTLMSAAAIMSLLGAAFLWFVVRKRQRTVWIPTLRILDLEAKRLPKLRLSSTSWVSFAVFLICSLMFAGLALRPELVRYEQHGSGKTRVHVLVDVSPSMAAWLSREELIQKVVGIWTGLADEAEVSMSVSEKGVAMKVESPEDIRALMGENQYQRGGLKIGDAVKELIGQVPDSDALILVSDSDQSSWDGFNWRAINDQTKVLRANVGDGASPTNVFINAGRVVNAPPAAKVVYEYEVVRNFDQEETTGKLSVSLGGKKLKEESFVIPVGKRSAMVRVSWSVDGRGFEVGSDELLEATLVDAKSNALTSDDTFRSYLKWNRRKVLLAAPATGERQLEDSAYHLDVALETIGFEVQRQDKINGTEGEVNRHPLWISVTSGPNAMQSCPTGVAGLRTSRQNSQNLADLPEARIWLVPSGRDSDYRQLCHCLHRVMLSESNDSPEPSYCAESTSREGWIEILKSTGGKQVGGEVGEEKGSIAWSFTEPSAKVSLLALTVPLIPRLDSNIRYATLPLMLRQLLQWHGALGPKRQVLTEREWPRIESIVDYWNDAEAGKGHDRTILLSNVPYGESKLAVMNRADLPPLLTEQLQKSLRSTVSREDETDPQLFFRIGVLMCLAAMLFEVIYRMRRQARLRVRKAAAGAIVLLAVSMIWNGRAEAQVEVVTLDSQKSVMELTSLASEVEARTSIELRRESKSYAESDQDIYRQPWLWVLNAADIKGKNGALKDDLATWMVRGGFFVVHGAVWSDADLQNLTAAMRKISRTELQWTAIPPDHEIMRSFYLLDALPECAGRAWRGLQFDGRLAALAPSIDLLAILKDKPTSTPCENVLTREQATRIFVNIMMVSLATDYKKDQIHLPEILKRLR
jgi:hypothetical protein